MKIKPSKLLFIIVVACGIIGFTTTLVINILERDANSVYNVRLHTFESQLTDIAAAYKTSGASEETQNKIITFYASIPQEVRESNNVVIADKMGNVEYKINQRYLAGNTSKLSIAWNNMYALMQDSSAGKNKWLQLCYLRGWRTGDNEDYTQIGELKYNTSLADVLNAYNNISQDMDAYVSIYPVEMGDTNHYIFWFRTFETDGLIYNSLLGSNTKNYYTFTMCGAILLLLYWLLLPVWVFLDARRWQTQPLPWALLILLTNLIGLVVYYIVKPQNGNAPPASACPACGKPVKKAYPYCPWCAVPLVKACKACGKPLEPGWTACPFCGTRIDGANANGD